MTEVQTSQRVSAATPFRMALCAVLAAALLLAHLPLALAWTMVPAAPPATASAPATLIESRSLELEALPANPIVEARLDGVQQRASRDPAADSAPAAVAIPTPARLPSPAFAAKPAAFVQDCATCKPPRRVYDPLGPPPGTI